MVTVTWTDFAIEGSGRKLSILICFTFSFVFVSCKTERRVDVSKLDSLRSSLMDLDTGCLDFSNLYLTIENVNHDKIIDREKNSWLFDLEKNEPKRFERADEMAPICKLFENDSILAIVLADWYDYKQALHVFIFKKPGIKPISSFILYSTGGDAEAFWNIECKQLNKYRYQLTDIEGYYSDIMSFDATFIDHRIIKMVTIDSITGSLEKELISEEKNISSPINGNGKLSMCKFGYFG